VQFQRIWRHVVVSDVDLALHAVTEFGVLGVHPLRRSKELAAHFSRRCILDKESRAGPYGPEYVTSTLLLNCAQTMVIAA
jgi:hypothetical protein